MSEKLQDAFVGHIGNRWFVVVDDGAPGGNSRRIVGSLNGHARYHDASLELDAVKRSSAAPTV